MDLSRVLAFPAGHDGCILGSEVTPAVFSCVMTAQEEFLDVN